MRGNRIDANQPDVVSDLRKLGMSVAITSSLGGGFPDLVVGTHNRNYLVELKDPSKPQSARKLTPAERKFRDVWRGNYVLALRTEDIVEAIKQDQKGNR